MDEIRQCLEARRRTLLESIDKRTKGQQDFSGWRFEDLEGLKGRYEEVKNTLDMMNHHCS